MKKTKEKGNKNLILNFRKEMKERRNKYLVCKFSVCVFEKEKEKAQSVRYLC